MRIGRSLGTHTCCKVSGRNLPNSCVLTHSGLGSGSCGLDYRIVKVPKTLRDNYTGTLSSWTSSFFSRRCPCLQLTDCRLTEPQPKSSLQKSFPSSGPLCLSTLHIHSSGTSFYLVNGVVPGLLTQETMAPVLVCGAQDLEADLPGSVVGIIVVVLCHLPVVLRHLPVVLHHLPGRSQIIVVVLRHLPGHSRIIVVVLCHLPLLTQRMVLCRSNLKDKVEGRAFGQV